MTRPRSPAGLARVAGIVLAVAFAALLAYGLTTRAPDRTIDEALADNEAVPAPGFDLEVLYDGRPGPLAAVWRRASADGRVSLAELRGTPVVVNMWASWCAPCRDEAAVLQRGWTAARRRGVLFVGLDSQDTREDALDFIDQFGQDFPQVRDGTRDTLRRWGTTGIPETFFISSRGDVVGHRIGTVTGEVLAAGVEAAVASRPLGPSAGGAQRPAR